MDKMREQFESYWTARCNELGIECSLTMFSNGEYCNNSAHYAWIGWKASRESLVVELPKIVGSDMDGSNSVIMLSETIKALESIGIKGVQK